MFNKKKKEKEYKEKLKQEIIKELKQEELKQEQKIIEQSIKTPVVEHSKEELEDIRKSFLKVFLFSITVLFVIITILILNPFSEKKEKDSDNENESPKVDTQITLITKEDGIIENTNNEMLNLFNSLVPNIEEYFLYDSTYLYSRDELKVDSISHEYLLYLMSKSDSFKKVIDETGLLTKLEMCSTDNTIRIPVETINTLIYDLFNVNKIEYEDFVYTHYINGTYSTYIEFKYSDGYYVGFCSEKEDNIKYTSIAKPVIQDANKQENVLTIRTKVAFITKDKVYADYSLSKEISNDPTVDMLTYINLADTYEYKYKLINNKFKLESIVKK